MSYELMLDCDNKLIVHDLLRPVLMESPCPAQWDWEELYSYNHGGTVSWTGSGLSVTVTTVPSGDASYADGYVDLDCLVAVPCGVTGLKATAAFSNTEDVANNDAFVVADGVNMRLSAFPGDSLTEVASVPPALFYRCRIRLMVGLTTVDDATPATGTVNFQWLYT